MSAIRRQFIVKDEAVGKRLDVFTAEKVGQVSRSGVKRLIDRQKLTLVRQNKQTNAKPGTILRSGDLIKIDLNKPTSGLMPKILFEDDQVVVINKPAGLLSHPKSVALDDEWTVVDAVSSHTVGVPRQGMVHRLDRVTSGVMVFAKTSQMHKRLSIAFAKRKVDKVYLALISTTDLLPKQIQLNIVRDSSHKGKFKVSSEGKVALTEVINQTPGKTMSLVELKLLTGRTHQLRVHLASLGAPIVGDSLYGAQTSSYTDRIMLHAYGLKLNIGGYPEFIAKIPNYMLGLMREQTIECKY